MFNSRNSELDRNLGVISRECMRYLNDLKYKNNKDSVVFDIDQTLINLNGKCIQPIKDVYDCAIKYGFNVFIITARLQSSEAFTKEQLNSIGINKYMTIYYRSMFENDIHRYKLECRKFITSCGYNIIMSIGDSYWDFGEFGGRGILVPTY
jgi:predicted secreted acid phosphatase